MDEERQGTESRLLRTSSSQATPGFPYPHGVVVGGELAGLRPAD